jgi:hypothetical protein
LEDVAGGLACEGRAKGGCDVTPVFGTASLFPQSFGFCQCMVYVGTWDRRR